jgi:hypothetical protein
MRACAAVLIGLLAIPAFPQCNISPVFSTQFRSTFNDLAIDGNDLWTATSYGVSLYDRGVDPPAFVASLALPGTTRVVRVLNGSAYVASGNAVAVVQKNGRALKLVRTTDAGAQVNDLAVTGAAVYAATANGLAQFDLLDWSRRNLATSSPNVTSLALSGNTLYAADGDSSVETFNIDIPSLPQATGALAASLARVTSVEANGVKLYASDGRQTDVFIGTTRAATLPFGVTALAPLPGDAAFVAAQDRTLNAFDFSTTATPIGIFSTAVAPSFGNVNRVLAVATAANRLYAAAGDAGLLAYDLNGFNAPYPLHAYAAGNLGSVISLGDKLYVPRAGGGVTEYIQSSTGALTQARSWDNHPDTIFDGGNSFILTGSGNALTLWSVFATAPSAVGTATFRAAVVSAVLRGTVAWAVLADGTLWTADLAPGSPAPQQIALPVKPTSIARSGNALAVLEPHLTDGTTNVLYAANADFTNAASVNVPGVATAPIALDGATAAVYTFRGINLIDFASGAVTVVPQSNIGIVRSLLLGGSTILALTDSTLSVFSSQKLVKQFAIPGIAATVGWLAGSGPNVADVATDAGLVTVALSSTSRLPAPIASTNGNAFYKKVVAAGDRVVLFDNRGADIFTASMQHTGSAHAAGMVDVAVSTMALYALFSNRTIAKYTLDGAPLSPQTAINDAPDTTPLAIFTVGNAVWVSISKGCTTGGCQKSTLIYDANLSQTATLGGGVVDVAVDGSNAYAIVDQPSEVRAYDVSDATHPRQTASRAAEGAQVPVSISASNGAVYVLGDKLYAYDGAMNKLGEQFPAYTSTLGSPVTFIDQRVRTANGCGLVSGRAFDATLYTTASPVAWTANAKQFPAPSAVRSLAQVGSVFYVLTDHSLEIWANAPLAPLPRKRAAH